MEVIPLNPKDFAVHPCDHIRPLEELHNAIMSQATMRQSSLHAKLSEKTTSVPASAIDLAEKMLSPNPQDRISSTDALRHPYFNEAPLSVMNIAAEFSPDEWNDLVRAGRTPTTES
jgi:serine/threonine protein kinase